MIVTINQKNSTSTFSLPSLLRAVDDIKYIDNALCKFPLISSIKNIYNSDLIMTTRLRVVKVWDIDGKYQDP